MPKSVEQMIDELIGREGGYSNNPADAGGETMWGITVARARRAGYQGAMRDMPRATAAQIYRRENFEEPGFSLVYALSQAIGEELFDTGVNMGLSVPGPWLQRLLNALNRAGKTYPDISVDGRIGPQTIGALRAYLFDRGAAGEKVLLRGLNSLQGARYLELTEQRQANEVFFYGWLLNRVEIA